ncbi:hypothetical protein FisN_3Hh378 [Fistulifera solaris]|jgi:hypothetical protein|uniref:Trafficking protein particle complex subunit 13 N-terminal domain-containing protein n=1 Tax=Fistulifera solaris TaxID=1519565 RepID=A0A1Z5JQT8_FISSO|nr:hypothetical protein FisN_3Hh378 [Fistulifera solaris]|eukprot:GAX16141.1 hypothetical protein FisN_3Hh378 [Fistulifera solaris]
MTEVHSSSTLDQETAVPTLRVMRLQSPELHQSVAGTLEGYSLLERSLCLPDSLAVYVGECFTAYLGILNTSSNWPIRRLRVSAQLQTPSQRWQLPSRLDNVTGGIDIEPLSGKDAIVSHLIEEPGQHILRVEVAYMTADGGSKTFRKFYRFQVTAPLEIRQSIFRCGDSCCFVTIDVEYNLSSSSSENKPASETPLVISDASFVPSDGLEAVRIHPSSINESVTALSLFDQCTILNKGSCLRYLFRVEAVTPEAILRGISADDVLGKAVFRWRKAMGETGECSSSPAICPPVDTSIMNRSGLSVDLAAAAATVSTRPDRQELLDRFPVTVEPIDPPPKLVLNVPQKVQFLVVNHAEQSLSVQWQLRSSLACGRHFQSLGELAPRGGSTVVTGRLLARDTGLLTVDGCVVVDLISGKEWPQPALFQVMVE